MKIVKNEKGFSFTEILAVITIIGILSVIGIAGVSRYQEQAKQKDYDALAKSSYSAFEEYQMTHPRVTKINLEDLLDDEYISNLIDPSNKSNECSGSVEYEEDTTSNIKTGVYKVNLCCQTYQKTYTYPEGTKKQITDTSICSVINPEPTIEPSVEPSPSTSPSASPSPTPSTSPSLITCEPGNYLPKASRTCKLCTSGYYCPGGTWNYSSTDNQGLIKCPGRYSHSEEGSSKIKQCFMNVMENHFVKKAYDKKSTKCPAGYIKENHTVYYSKKSKCNIDKTFNRIELMRVYFIKYKNKNCTGDKPIRRYTYHAYACQCEVNNAGIYIGTLHNEPYEVNFHAGEDMVIYYNNNEKGINSCENANGYYINQNVKEVCKDGEFDYAGNNSAYLHGYKWYKYQEGSDVMYHKFQSAWAHSKGKFDERYKTGTDIVNTKEEREAACNHACELFSGEY